MSDKPSSIAVRRAMMQSLPKIPMDSSVLLVVATDYGPEVGVAVDVTTDCHPGLAVIAAIHILNGVLQSETGLPRDLLDMVSRAVALFPAPVRPN